MLRCLGIVWPCRLWASFGCGMLRASQPLFEGRERTELVCDGSAHCPCSCLLLLSTCVKALRKGRSAQSRKPAGSSPNGRTDEPEEFSQLARGTPCQLNLEAASSRPVGRERVCGWLGKGLEHLELENVYTAQTVLRVRGEIERFPPMQRFVSATGHWHA